MSEFFEDVMTGLNEAIAIERGEITGKKTVCENQIEKEEEQNSQTEQPVD